MIKYFFAFLVFLSTAISAQCPRLVSIWPDESACSVVVKGNYAYVGDIWGDTIHIVDLSNFAYPIEVAVFGLDGFFYDIQLHGDYLAIVYITSDYYAAIGVLKILNEGKELALVSNCTVPLGYKTYMLGNQSVGDLIYLATDALYVISIEDKANPFVLSTESIPPGESILTFVKISGSYAYIGWHEFFPPETGGIAIVDISDATNPRWVIGISAGASEMDISPWAAEICGNYLFYSPYWLDPHNYIIGGVGIIDISDPENPQKKGYLDIGAPFAFLSKYNKLYLAALAVYDVSDCLHPDLIGEYDVYGRAYKMVFFDRYIFGANDGLGMFIFDLSDCQKHRRPVAKP